MLFVSVYVDNVHRKGDSIVLVHVPEYNSVVQAREYFYTHVHTPTRTYTNLHAQRTTRLRTSTNMCAHIHEALAYSFKCFRTPNVDLHIYIAAIYAYVHSKGNTSMYIYEITYF